MAAWWTFLILAGFTALAAHSQCVCPAGWETASTGYTHKTYAPLPDNVTVPNPGRGFYKQKPVEASHFSPLSVQSLKADRTVVQRMYYMDTYINKSLDAEWIRHVKTDLSLIKHQGWMVVLRFSYTHSHSGAHDAGLHRALEHIQYLGDSNLFTEFEGVIATIQAGFIGVWGEWYEATGDFGRPGSCSGDHMFHLTTSQWVARQKVLKALLTVVPKSIQIELRYPWFKYKLLGDTPTTFHDVANGTDRGRVGFHNDAFLSTTADMGTYKCDGDRDYLARESRFGVVSGETNYNKSVSRYECKNAMAEMARYHWSLLNEAFLRQVIDYWKTHGCYDEIAAKLGYRLYLINATLPVSAQSGGSVCLQLTVGNNGYAAPYKQMDLHVLLKNTQDGVLYSSQLLGYDVRQWLPGGTYTVKGEVGIPSDLRGSFKVYLAVTSKVMQYNEKYFVMMANTNMTAGPIRINDLNHVINITRGTCNVQPTNPIGYWKGHTDGCISMDMMDGSFEDDALGWGQQGFQVVTGSDAQDGTKYITVTNGDAVHTLDFSRSPIYNFTLSGYSRAHADTHIHLKWKYTIKCDLDYTDGSRKFNRYVQFDQNTRGVWMFRKLVVQSLKPIKTARCHAYYKSGNGSVDFDNFVLNTCIYGECTYKLRDGSFEDVTKWNRFRNGFHLKTNQVDALDDNSYITVSNGSAFQTVNFTGSGITEFTIVGYSRAHHITVRSPSDYSINCDIQYADGSARTGEYALFDPTSDSATWQRAQLHLTASQPINHVTCHAMLKGLSGHADFDNFQIVSCL